MDKIQIEQGIRLKTLLKALSLNQTAFAISLGMTQPNIHRMVSGKNKISMEVLNGISKTYTHVNLHWLLTGDGTMFLDQGANPNRQANEDADYNKANEKMKEVEQLSEQLEDVLKKLLKILTP